MDIRSFIKEPEQGFKLTAKSQVRGGEAKKIIPEICFQGNNYPIFGMILNNNL
jgi:hypothetical protein